MMAGGGGGGSSSVSNEEERRVVVAVDESEESLYALQWWLCNLLRPTSAGVGSEARVTVVLLYARPSPPVYSTMDGTGSFFSRDVTATMEKYIRDLADSVIGKAKSVCSKYGKMKVDAKVSAGDARDVICETVDELGADLLVMGSHGYGFIKRALLGSVSDYCARNAKCPVLIVKRKEA